jgi:thiamine biosynthesis lipoprotein
VTGRDDLVTVASVHQPVMGTHLEVRVTAASEQEARAAEAAIVAEAQRLERIFTVFDPSSELCAWRSGQVAEAGPELSTLLLLAASWQERTAGAFNPFTGVLTDRWLQAERDQVAPAAGELAELARSIAAPRFAAEPGTPVRPTGSCHGLDLNALAKGHVVDLVVDWAWASFDLARLVVNAGGDLVHRGMGSARIGVEDPRRAHDNVAPRTVVVISDQAVATSGRARRWFSVGGAQHSRVLDPRTGSPVDGVASATVVAPDAATADVLATVASVLAPEEAVAFVDGLLADEVDAACLLIASDRTARWSTNWTGGVQGPWESSSASTDRSSATPPSR